MFQCGFSMKLASRSVILLGAKAIKNDSLCSIVANVLDCDIIVSKFKLQSHN